MWRKLRREKFNWIIYLILFNDMEEPLVIYIELGCKLKVKYTNYLKVLDDLFHQNQISK